FRDRSSSASISRWRSSSIAAIPSREAPAVSVRSLRASCSVPTAGAAALICDISAVLDYLVKSAPDHQRFRDIINRALCSRFGTGRGRLLSSQRAVSDEGVHG